MSLPSETTTIHDLESSLSDTQPSDTTPIPPSGDEVHPAKTIVKKKSVFASAFGSLRSRFHSSDHNDADCPVHIPREPRTPQKSWKKFATLRGTRSENKQENDKPRERQAGDSGTSEPNTTSAKKAKRRKSLGDFLGSLSGKNSHRLLDVLSDVPTVVVTSPSTKSKMTDGSTPPNPLPESDFLRVLAHNSDKSNGDIPPGSKDRSETSSAVPFGHHTAEEMSPLPRDCPILVLPDPMLGTNELSDDFQPKHNLVSRSSSSRFSRVLHSILPKDNNSSVDTKPRIDSAIGPQLDNYGDLSVADCRGVQQDSPRKISYCTPGTFQESVHTTSTMVPRIRCELPTWNDEINDELDSLFGQADRRDETRPSLDAYTPGEQFDLFRSKRPKDLLANTSLATSFKALEPFFIQAQGFEDRFHNKTLEPTTSEAHGFEDPYHTKTLEPTVVGGRGFEDPFHSNQYLELTCHTSQVPEAVPLSTFCFPERAVKTFDFDSISLHKDIMADRHAMLFDGTSQQHEVSEEHIERKIALTAEKMSQHYRLPRSSHSRQIASVSDRDDTCTMKIPDVYEDFIERQMALIAKKMSEHYKVKTSTEGIEIISPVVYSEEDNTDAESCILTEGSQEVDLDDARGKACEILSDDDIERIMTLALMKNSSHDDTPQTTVAESIPTDSVSSLFEDTFGPGSLKVSFPQTEDHGAFTREFESRNEAIHGIFELCREEYSDYCTYDIDANVLHVRLGDETSVLDIISAVEKGQAIVWLPISLQRQEDAEIDDVVWNQQDSGDTVDVELDSFHSDSVHSDSVHSDSVHSDSVHSDVCRRRENTSLANIDGFPRYEAAAPFESFCDYMMISESLEQVGDSASDKQVPSGCSSDHRAATLASNDQHAATSAETKQDSSASTPTKSSPGGSPMETFGGTPHGLAEPFPPYNEKLAATVSKRNTPYDEAIISVREIGRSDSDYCGSEVAEYCGSEVVEVDADLAKEISQEMSKEISSSDSDYCGSEVVEVDVDLARRYLGGDFCDSYLDVRESLDSQDENAMETTAEGSKGRAVDEPTPHSVGDRTEPSKLPPPRVSSLSSGSNTIVIPIRTSASPLLLGFNFSKFSQLDISQTRNQEQREFNGKSKEVSERKVQASGRPHLFCSSSSSFSQRGISQTGNQAQRESKGKSKEVPECEVQALEQIYLNPLSCCQDPIFQSQNQERRQSQGKSKEVTKSEDQASVTTCLASEGQHQQSSPGTPKTSKLPRTPKSRTAITQKCSLCGAVAANICKRASATDCTGCGTLVRQQNCPQCGWSCVMHTCAICGREPTACRGCFRSPGACSICGFVPLPPLPGTPKPTAIPRSPSKTKAFVLKLAGRPASARKVRSEDTTPGNSVGTSEDRYVPGQYPDEKLWGSFYVNEAQTSTEGSVSEDLD